MKVWAFVRANKWWVIVPIALVLAIFLAFVLLTDTGTVQPFIYN